MSARSAHQTELDPVIHAPARLKVMATLAALRPDDSLSFPRLQSLLAMTAGNLSTHLRRLEDAGYVAVEKTHRGRTPATFVALTPAGRLGLERYTEVLRALLAPSLPVEPAPEDRLVTEQALP